MHWSPKPALKKQNTKKKETIKTRILRVTPVQIQCTSMYINQALLLNSFFEMSICISLAALEVHSLPMHLFAYLLIPSYLLGAPDNLIELLLTRTFFSFPRRFELSRESIVKHIARDVQFYFMFNLEVWPYKSVRAFLTGMRREYNFLNWILNPLEAFL